MGSIIKNGKELNVTNFVGWAKMEKCDKISGTEGVIDVGKILMEDIKKVDSIMC